jgi:hypothetical protein
LISRVCQDYLPVAHSNDMFFPFSDDHSPPDL